MSPSTSLPCPLLILTLLLSLLTPHPQAQQIGSFFTAIQYNNGPLPAGSSPCGAMGGSAAGYCCGSGQTCAWDDSGRIACCTAGGTCSGSAGAGAGGAYAQGAKYSPSPQAQVAAAGYNGGGCNTCQNVCNTCQAVAPATTVYVPQSTYAAAPVVQTSSVQSSYRPSSVPTTVVTVPPTVAGGGVRVVTTLPVNQACGGKGYTTLTQANVGQPVRTVGCFVIFNAGAGRVKDARVLEWGVRGLLIGIVGWALWWIV